MLSLYNLDYSTPEEREKCSDLLKNYCVSKAHLLDAVFEVSIGAENQTFT